MPHVHSKPVLLVALATFFLSFIGAAALHRPSPTSPAHSAGLSAFLTPLRTSRTLRMAGDKAVVPAARATQRLGLRPGPYYTVTATGYEAVPGQTDDEPFVTADNSFIKPGYGSRQRWLALSNDLIKRWGGPFDYGDKVRVTGLSAQLDGVYTLHDTMNRRHRHCLDILVHPSEKFDIYQPGVRIQRVPE